MKQKLNTLLEYRRALDNQCKGLHFKATWTLHDCYPFFRASCRLQQALKALRVPAGHSSPLNMATPPSQTWDSCPKHVAVGQNQWYHFGVGAPPILEPILVGIGMFTGGTIRIFTHGHVGSFPMLSPRLGPWRRWTWTS